MSDDEKGDKYLAEIEEKIKRKRDKKLKEKIIF
jgi:hypothetical protein